MTYFLFILFAFIIFTTLFSQGLFSNIETPKYLIMKKEGSIEIRKTPPMTIAMTEVIGERGEAIREGFKRVAAYIFGQNERQQKVAMTAPVLQVAAKQPNPTPLSEEKNWAIYFVMPEKYTSQTLPKPLNDQVIIKKIESRLIAAIRFRGEPNLRNLESHLEKLEAYLKTQHIDGVSLPTFAFYDPPWRLPLLSRNEIWIEI